MRWEVIKDYPNYSISDTGIVKRNAYTRIDSLGRKTNVKEKILKLQTDKYGYYRTTLVKDGKNHFLTLHRLLATTFIPNPNNLPVINHKNENPKDNRLENLEWCTTSYNNNYGERQKRVSITQGKKIVGYKDDETITFHSAREAGRTLGVSASNISECANGKTKTAYGFIWRWA